MSWFRKSKSKQEKYKPIGRIGWYTKDTYPYYYTLIFEKIYDIATKSKVRLLEVDVRRDCKHTKEECIKHVAIGDWVSTHGVVWETDEQYYIRTNQAHQLATFNPEELLNDDIDYRQHPTNPFIHNFIENNNN